MSLGCLDTHIKNRYTCMIQREDYSIRPIQLFNWLSQVSILLKHHPFFAVKLNLAFHAASEKALCSKTAFWPFMLLLKGQKGRLGCYMQFNVSSFLLQLKQRLIQLILVFHHHLNKIATDKITKQDLIDSLSKIICSNKRMLII